MKRIGMILLVVAALLPAACGDGGLPTGELARDELSTDRAALSSSVPTPLDLTAVIGNGVTMKSSGSFGLGASRLVPGPNGSRAVRARYPAGSASHAAGGPEGGLQSYFALRAPTDAVNLSYQVRFPAGFDFVKGGKLPGLYGGAVNNGQKIPDGTNGLSTRYMWRSAGAGEVYAYLPTSKDHGTSLGRGCWTAPTGRWFTLRQRVVLNTPGRADGRIQVWLDNRPVYQATGLTFRTVGTLRIEGIFFSTFFGGDSDDYRTPRDQYADFADFRVTPAGPEPAGGTFPACTGRS